MKSSSQPVAAILLSVILLACAESKDDGPQPSSQAIRTVKTEIAHVRPARRLRRFPSVLEPPQLVPLAFEVGGRLGAVNLRVGQEVSAGEVLLTIEPTDLDLRLRQAEAALEEGKTQARLARDDADRHEALFDQKIVSRAARDRAVAQAAQAEARVDQAQSEVALLRESRSDADLTAPFDGVINAVEVQDVANVKEGETVLTLFRRGDLQASILVSYEVAESLEVGRSVTVRPLDGATGPLQATVTEIGRRAPAVSSFPVIVTLDRPPAVLRSGMAVEVQVEVEVTEAAGQIALPLSAIATQSPARLEDGPPYSADVLVFEPTDGHRGRLATRSVTISTSAEGRIFVSDGLSAGDIVVTAGVPFLRPGQTVRLMPEAP